MDPCAIGSTVEVLVNSYGKWHLINKLIHIYTIEYTIPID